MTQLLHLPNSLGDKKRVPYMLLNKIQPLITYFRGSIYLPPIIHFSEWAAIYHRYLSKYFHNTNIFGIPLTLFYTRITFYKTLNQSQPSNAAVTNIGKTYSSISILFQTSQETEVIKERIITEVYATIHHGNIEYT